MMNTTANEKRIANRARRIAKMVIALRDEGKDDEAERLTRAGQEVCQLMREGRA